jgi:hypothetical protein
MTAMTPPRWAEAVLRIVLPRRDRDPVSGDLLEEYREHVAPTRGVPTADRWYVRQVAGFVWRSQLGWAIALSAIFVGRTAIDWLVPTTDFSLRSAVTTYASMVVLTTAGAVAAWRSHSFAAGAIAGASVAIIAAAFDVAGAAVMLGFFHDSATLAAAEQSGGISEVFTLPIILIVPATVLGLLGGVPAAISQGLRR